MRRLGYGAAAMLLALALGAPSAAQFKRDPAEAAATERDYAVLIARMGIPHPRPGADGFNRHAPNASNRDEAKAGGAFLPDPLVMADGAPVRTPASWWNRRRPELVRLFDRGVYGEVPATAPRVRWEVVSTAAETKNGVAVVTRRLIGHAGEGSANPVAIQLRVTLPANVLRPVPLILEFGFPEDFRFPGMVPPVPGTDWTDQLLAKGWGYAVLVANSVQDDNGAGLTKGVIGLSLGGRPRGPEDWGTLRAWAWGASRAFDWLSRDPAIDAHRIGIEGLSRYGKAALVTMAYDRRFALGFIGSSGAGGAKPYRRDYGERIGNLAASGEYHWFAGNFLRYDSVKTKADLPIESDELIALAAPRTLFIGAGNLEADGWVDPRGSFLAAKAASPVWTLLGAKGLSGDEQPPIGTGLTGGDLAFRQHEGGHTNGPNWPAFIAWAARYFDAH